MSTIIKLKCLDQVLTFESTPVVASGGLEEDRIQVEFCSKWNGLTRTAVFWRSEQEAYHVPLDESDSCAIPPEVLTDEGVIYFGLFGVSSDGRQRTSQAMRYTIAKGAITDGTKPSDPTPDIYTELLARYQKVIEVSEATLAAEQAFEQAMQAAQTAFEQAMGQRQTQHEQAVDQDQAAFEQAMQAAQEAFEQEILAMIAAGLLPDDSVTTAKLKNGAVTAEKLAAGVMVDAYTKTETLKDETKALYGLNASAGPDGAFAKLSGLYLHHWTKTLLTESVSLTSPGNYVINSSGGTGGNIAVYYSNTVAMVDGKTELVNPQEFLVTYDTYTNANVLKGKYWYPNGSKSFVRFTPADAANATRRYASGQYIVEIYAATANLVTVRGEPEYLTSNDRNAYPDGGVHDGYEYEYLGVPFENAVTAPKIETGSYKGTGTYGASNRNSLTFGFRPKFVMIYRMTNASGASGFVNATFSPDVKNVSSFDMTYAVGIDGAQKYFREVGWSGNTVSWYTSETNAVYQLNGANCTYYYIAIG